MLSDLQARKAQQMFEIYDSDRDGVISWSDYTLQRSRLAEMKGWTAGSPAFIRFTEKLETHWSRMRAFADADRDEQLTVEEYKAYLSSWLDQPGALETLDGVADLWFDLLDDDDDGRVGPDEYRMSMVAYGLDDLDFDQMFSRFDLDGDGFVSREEVREFNRQYWLSTDMSQPGHQLLGPLEGESRAKSGGSGI